MVTLKLDLLQTLSLAAILYFVGLQLRQRIALLDRLNIPAAVVGGLLFALLVLAGRDRFLTRAAGHQRAAGAQRRVLQQHRDGRELALLRAGRAPGRDLPPDRDRVLLRAELHRAGDRARVRRAPAARRHGRLGDTGGRAGHGDGLRADAGAGGAGGCRHARAHLGHVRHRVRRADRHARGDLADSPLPPRAVRAPRGTREAGEEAARAPGPGGADRPRRSRR